MVIHVSQTKEELQALLRKGECEVIFRKKDGTLREMVCTLHPGYLPAIEEREGGSSKPPNENVVAVWDVQEEAWRSFRIDSLVEGPTLVDAL